MKKEDETIEKAESEVENDEAGVAVQSMFRSDSTSVTEISIMPNEEFSKWIIGGADRSYDLRRLERLLKENKTPSFYKEASKQMHDLLHASEAMIVHTVKFATLFKIRLGHILNLVEISFEKKSDYVNWLRSNFSKKHSRYFQHAKQLADMGKFAEDNAAAGKNRLLEIERQRKALKKDTCKDVLGEYSLPDITEDEDGELMKDTLDTIITIHHLKNAGIDYVEFDQAALIASFNGEAITLKTARDWSEWLKEYEEEKRREVFDSFVQDKLHFPSDQPPKSNAGESKQDPRRFCGVLQ